MATQCRRTKISRNKLMKIYAYGIIVMLMLVGGAAGFLIGRISAPIKTETVTVFEIVEVSAYEPDSLPEAIEVCHFDVPLSNNLQNYIYEVCTDEGVPVSLVLAMIEYESQFDSEAISSSDDYGLMQINEINHEWLEEDYRCADMLNPYQNVFCGVKIIGEYIEKYDDYGKALMAYNMGDYGASSAWENGIESTNYSTNILELMQKYEEVLNNADDDSAQ